MDKRKTKQLISLSKYLILLLILFISCKQNNKEIECLFKIENKNDTFIYTYDKNLLLSKYKIQNKLNKIVIFSSSQYAFLKELGLQSRIIAVSNKNYFYDSFIHNNNKIDEVGDVQSINIEKIITHKPDLVLIPNSGLLNSKIIELFKGYKINYLITNEFSEPTVLKQSKWILVYGVLFDKNTDALNKYLFLEKSYNEAKKSIVINGSKRRPKVITGINWRGQWFISGNNSHLAKIIYDAGGKYFFDEYSEGNLSLDLEKILILGIDSDLWINIGTSSSRSDILARFGAANQIKAYRNSKCFNNTNKINSKGANDYWEYGVVRPDLILKDLISIIYNDTMYKREFYTKL